MPITLAQAKVGLADRVTQTVIDEFRRDSHILDALTFDNAVSPGTGGSTLTYGYVQLLTPSMAAGRAINSEYTAGEAIKTKKTTDIKIMGGSFQVDRVLEDTAAMSEIAFQLEQKTKAVKNLFHNNFINGDSTTDTLAFDGLDKLITGADTEVTTSVDVSTMANIKANGSQLAFELNEMISKMAEKPDMLLMNSHMLNTMITIAREMGYYTRSEDAFGRAVAAFNGIAMVDMGKYFDGTSSKDVIATDATAGTTDIYAVKYGLDALCGVSPTGNKVVNAYLPDMKLPGAVKTGEVELLATIALKNSRMAGVLRGIKSTATE